MMGVDSALTHVMRLTATDLSPERLFKMRTARWGFVAKAFPPFSRYLFLFIGIGLAAALIIALLACPSSGDSAWDNVSCSAPWPAEPKPARDLAIICVPWCLVASFGLCTKTSGIQMPHLYVPVPEKEGPVCACLGCCASVVRCCHP